METPEDELLLLLQQQNHHIQNSPPKPRTSIPKKMQRRASSSTDDLSNMVCPIYFLKVFLLFLATGSSFSILSVHLTRQTGVKPAKLRHVDHPCPEETNGLDRYIKPPSSLIHSMTDEELLWTASFAPAIENYPFNRTPKVAFLFLTMGPLPLAPLWEMFFKGHEGFYSIYIHALPTYVAKFTPDSVFYQRFVPSKVAEWGQMSICDAERRLLANALLDISNERFVLLSESCIPLKDFNTTYNYLIMSKHSFVHIMEDGARYNPNMAPEINATVWRKGSQWFEVSRELAQMIVSDSVYYPKILYFCQAHWCYPDEHYFQTILHTEKPELLANRSVTWVDWSRGGSHPATFGEADVKEWLMKWILDDQNCEYNGLNSTVCVLFARKFAPSALETLVEVLSPTLLGLQQYGEGYNLNLSST
ncbi:hypothetical protein LUZ62_034353 [Rhynchospora pubera]|uniref:Uncharacterized protein n=1 Tax=Rhynchospora pubera TaxID=906938 RepID=A0AAV8EYN2_9POAL|nr:hypothetical protein LUZ62_034353 [Rhynchospora pubera]